MDEKIIQLAALLHDIGKFWQGAGEKGKHSELSSRFIQEYVPEQWQGAAGVVSLHHEPSKYRSESYKPLKTIVCADWLSSGEHRRLEEEEKKGERQKLSLSQANLLWCCCGHFSILTLYNEEGTVSLSGIKTNILDVLKE
jgi:hypothetical protein